MYIEYERVWQMRPWVSANLNEYKSFVQTLSACATKANTEQMENPLGLLTTITSSHQVDIHEAR